MLCPILLALGAEYVGAIFSHHQCSMCLSIYSSCTFAAVMLDVVSSQRAHGSAPVYLQHLCMPVAQRTTRYPLRSAAGCLLRVPPFKLSIYGGRLFAAPKLRISCRTWQLNLILHLIIVSRFLKFAHLYLFTPSSTPQRDRYTVPSSSINLNIGCLLHADYMILMSPSVKGLQDMMNLCVKACNTATLVFNAKSHFVFVHGNYIP